MPVSIKCDPTEILPGVYIMACSSPRLNMQAMPHKPHCRQTIPMVFWGAGRASVGVRMAGDSDQHRTLARISVKYLNARSALPAALQTLIMLV